jgi:hypothetical protein
MIPKSPATHGSDEPRTIFEYERRLRSKLDEPDGERDAPYPRMGGPQYPRLPSSSPWSSGVDQLTGPEPPIDRTEDS